jgi:CubicO group peptidase (beta-lactamase class C family)
MVVLMRHSFLLILSIIAAYIGCDVATEGPGVTELELGKTIQRSISGGEADTFRVHLERDQFMFASVFQTGIDVVVKVHNPIGEKIDEIDNLPDGPEFISLTSKTTGSYQIEILPFYPMASRGNYHLTVEKLENADTTLSGRVNQLFAEFDNERRPGCAVAIVQNGKIIYKNGFGLANLAAKTPITPSTKLNICSIGKQFTAFAVALLAQQGKLSLDDDIRKHIPEVPDFGSKISLRHLIHHTSGLREIDDLLGLAGHGWNDPWSKEVVLRLVSQQKDLNFPPGDEYLYCNTSYILLGEIVARVTGTPFQQWMTENIFEPLGMNQTVFFHDPGNFTQKYAMSYGLTANRKYRAERMSKCWYVGAGNVFSTVEDMGKWLINFSHPKVGDEQLMRQLEEQGILNSGDKIDYAFGMVADDNGGLKSFSHGGGGYGYRSHIVRFPEEEFGVIILSNFVYGDPWGRTKLISDLYLADQFTAEKPEGEYHKKRKSIAINPGLLDEYVGTYRDESGILTTVTRTENQLMARKAGEAKLKFYPETDGTFFIKEADVLYSFQKNERGDVTRLTVRSGDAETHFERVLPSALVRKNLAEYKGKYHSDELGSTFTIGTLGSGLVTSHRRHGRIQLTQVRDDLFKADAPFSSWIQFERNDANRIVGFKITRDRVRNVRFERRTDES